MTSPSFSSYIIYDTEAKQLPVKLKTAEFLFVYLAAWTADIFSLGVQWVKVNTTAQRCLKQQL